MKTVEMPKMGDTMEEGKILRWIKQEGDPVKKGESLAEVETDKVNIEIEAFAGGVLRKILVPEGKSASIGAGIALIGAPDEPLPEGVAGNGAAQSAASTPAGAAKSAKIAEAPAQEYAQAVSGRGGVRVAPPMESQGRIFISPAARRRAEESQLDYPHVQGTGPNGRIIRRDVEAARAKGRAGAPPRAAPPVTAPAAP